MIIKVLGAGAGGGYPQWNCSCHNCTSVRSGQPGFTARTQSSLAVSANGSDWVLLNASPDLRQQISATPELLPSNSSLRSSPIKAAVLTNGDVDHIAGLINLREAQPFTIYATERVLGVLKSNSIFGILAPGVVDRIPLPLDVNVPLRGADTDLGLSIEAFDVPGKIALYLEDAAAGPGFGTQSGDTIGLKITDTATGTAFFYVPGCAEVNADVARRIKRAPLLFFDGTLYDDDEMIHQGLLAKSGERMGHVSMSGSHGSIAAFSDLEVGRKVYVHINNSNPVLDSASEESRAVTASGWEIGYDGMEVRL